MTPDDGRTRPTRLLFLGALLGLVFLLLLALAVVRLVPLVRDLFLALSYAL